MSWNLGVKDGRPSCEQDEDIFGYDDDDMITVSGWDCQNS